jgi:ABC-type polysaccharide/polyol phosphate transport system ATPase subunit
LAIRVEVDDNAEAWVSRHAMSEWALKIESVSKRFRVPRAEADSDPRRERLGRRRDLFWALRDVSLDVTRGETIGIVGANGSGKSTLLKILSGVMTADAGGFEAHGRIGALLELGAGFHPDLTGVENVYLNGALLGLSTMEIDRLLPDIIAFAELERFMDMPVKHFSSGMTTRLGFAVATRLAPDILLMDETFATGDARFQSKALGHIAEMKARGHTMLVVSHNMVIVMMLCDRVAWMDMGRLRRVGEPAEVIAEYQRSQQMAMHQVGPVRAALGMESLFPVTQGEGAAVRIADARLNADGREEAPGGVVSVRTGEGVQLEVGIEYEPDRAPRTATIETAWVRADHRIVAQGRTRVALPRDRTAVRVRLAWRPWRLEEGEYRLGLAIGPAAAEEPLETASDATPAVPFDRRLDCGMVRMVSPNTADLPVLTRLACRWEVSGVETGAE